MYAECRKKAGGIISPQIYLNPPSSTKKIPLPPLHCNIPLSPVLPSRRTPPPAAPSLPACVARTVASTTVPADYLSPLRRMVLTPSEPRSVRADGIPGSERHATACHASAGQGSVTRRPGEGERRPPFGRAAEHARSAARASPGQPRSAPALLYTTLRRPRGDDATQL